jgi:hypothetical protein
MAHTNKQFMQVVHWAKKHMMCGVDETRMGLKITPQVKAVRAWTCHPDDKGMYDLMRYLAKVSGVTKRDIENAVNLDIPLK